jgi:hypothetical protein
MPRKIKELVLRGYIYREQIVVHCPYCDAEHHHGATDDVLKGKISHRSSHCWNQDSPFKNGGYYVGIWNEIEKKE